MISNAYSCVALGLVYDRRMSQYVLYLLKSYTHLSRYYRAIIARKHVYVRKSIWTVLLDHYVY